MKSCCRRMVSLENCLRLPKKKFFLLQEQHVDRSNLIIKYQINRMTISIFYFIKEIEIYFVQKDMKFIIYDGVFKHRHSVEHLHNAEI